MNSENPPTRELARGDFHARSRFARSTIPEEKWGTTRSLAETCKEIKASEGQAESKKYRLSTIN